jgi:SNF2 family DNA or RNA helicase
VSAADNQTLFRLRDWLRSVAIPSATGERRLFEWEINVLIESHLARLEWLSDPRCAQGSGTELAALSATYGMPPSGGCAWLLNEAEVQRLASRALEQAPSLLRLKPFQMEGLRYILSRGGRALIADEMGCGKTIQALAAVAAFGTWPVIIITPASLRLVWVEEIERWLPQILRPSDIHVIFESNDMLPQSREVPISAKVVITSYTMCRLLTASGNLLRRKWGMAVVDESHHIRNTRGLTAPAAEIQLLLALLEGIPRVLLCSGTPSLSRWIDIYAQVELLRPGTLGAWQAFYEAYDQHTLASTTHGAFLSPGRCRRPQELRLLLRESVMIRRMKSEVLEELPPKTRHRVRLPVEQSVHGNLVKELSTLKTSYEAAGIYKAHACSGWLRTTIFKRRGGLDDGASDPGVVMFAHHLKVLDQLEQVLQTVGVKYSRIDGSTPVRERSKLLCGARDGSVSVMLIGITACAQGVDLSWATVAVFVELPPDAGWIQQARVCVRARTRAHLCTRSDARGEHGVWCVCAGGGPPPPAESALARQHIFPPCGGLPWDRV